MEITRIFCVDSSGVITNISVVIENCVTEYCPSCIFKRISNPLFDTGTEFESVLNNCLVANENRETELQCRKAHLFLY